MSTLALSVTLFKKYDEGLITVDATALSGKKGYIKITVDSLVTVTKDVPSDGLPYNYSPAYVVPAVDQVPNFIVMNEPMPGGYGSENRVIEHPLSKISGTKPYTKKMMLFAVNNGKLDANAHSRPSNNGTSGTSTNVLMRAILAKVDEWPCDDDVTATLNFTKTESLA